MSVSTESALDDKEVSTESGIEMSDELPQITIQEVLTLDQLIKEKGVINIFEDSILGYLQSLLKNKLKSIIFNEIYNKVLAPVPEKPSLSPGFIPILNNQIDKVSLHEGLPDDINYADIFTGQYIEYRRRLDKTTEPDTIARIEKFKIFPLISAQENTLELTNEPREYYIAGEGLMAISFIPESIMLDFGGMKWRLPPLVKSTYLADQQHLSFNQFEKELQDAPTLQSVLDAASKLDDIHDVRVLLDRHGFSKVVAKIDHVETEEVSPFDVQEVITPAVIKSFWQYLNESIKEAREAPVPTQEIRKPDLEHLETPNIYDLLEEIRNGESISIDSIIDRISQYRKNEYEQLMFEIYNNFMKTSLSIRKNDLEPPKDIRHLSAIFQFIKLYNEIQEIQAAENTSSYIGSVYEGTGFVEEAEEVTDAVDFMDEMQDFDPEVPEEGVAEIGPVKEKEPRLDPLEEYEFIENYITDNESILSTNAFVWDIITTLKPFLKIWIFNSGLSSYFRGDFILKAIQSIKLTSYNSRQAVLKQIIKREDKIFPFNIPYSGYIANYTIDLPGNISDEDRKLINSYVKEANDIFTISCYEFIKNLTLQWSLEIYNRIINNEPIINTSKNMSYEQKQYWDLYGYPLIPTDRDPRLKSGLIKYLCVTAEDSLKFMMLEGRSYIEDNVYFKLGNNADQFYKFFNRGVNSSGVEIKEINKSIINQKYNKTLYYSHFEESVFDKLQENQYFISIIARWNEIKDTIRNQPLLILKQRMCNDNKFISNISKEINANSSTFFYHYVISRDLTYEYTKIYRCLASIIPNMTDNEDNQRGFEIYLKKHFHNNHLLTQIGANLKPDSDWMDRGNFNDKTELFLTLLKTKMKFDRFAFKRRHPLKALMKQIPILEEVEEVELPQKEVNIPSPEEDLAIDIDILSNVQPLYTQLNNYIKGKSQIEMKFNEYWNYKNVTYDYPFYRSLYNHMIKDIYGTDNLNKIIDAKSKISPNLSLKKISSIYRDLCVLLMFIPSLNKINIEVYKSAIRYYSIWIDMPINYDGIDNIITEQREKNKDFKLKQLEGLSLEEKNLRREGQQFGFKV